MTTPALPPGFVLVDQATTADPPLPPGFVEQDVAALPDFSGVRSAFRAPEPDRITDALPGGPVTRALLRSGEDATRAAAHHFGNALHGGAQAIEHGVGWLADQVLPGDDVGSLVGGGSLGQRARRAIRDTIEADDAALRQREADYQAQVPDSVAASLGAVTGAVAPFLASGGRLGGNVVTGALGGGGLARILGGVAEGTAGAALAPVLGDNFADEKAKQVGLGAVVGGGLPIVGNVVRYGKPLADFVGRFTDRGATRAAAEQIRDEATDLARVMTPNASQVPGVQRTLAEESLDPGVSRLQQHLRGQRGGGAFANRATENNAARVDALRGFAGDETAIDAAKAARSAAATPLLNAAEASTMPVDIKPVVSQIEGALLRLDGRPQVASALRDLRGLLYRETTPAERALQPDVERVLRDDVLTIYNVRKTIGDWLSTNSEKPAAQAAKRELLEVRQQLDDALEASSPEFRQYMDAFRAGSRDVNRLQFGRELLEGGAGKNIFDELGNPILTPNAFGGQAATSGKLQRTAKTATGFAKAEPAAFLEASDMATIRAIGDDLNRVGNVTRQGLGAGSPTTPLRQIEDRLTQSVIGRLPLVGGIAETLNRAGNQQVTTKLIRLLQNPEEARAALEALPPADARTLADVLYRMSGLAGNVAGNAVEVDVVGGNPASRAEVERTVNNIRPR